MNRPRSIALALTVVTAALVVLLLRCGTLTVGALDREWPPRNDSEVTIAAIDEQYFDIIEDVPVPVPQEAAPAPSPVKQTNKSKPAPRSGHDVTDRGPEGDAPATVTSKRQSDVQAPAREQTQPQGPTKEELEKQAVDEARRRATAATASAFQRSEGKNNTLANGKNEGDSGTPSGTSTTVNGNGTGTVGGG